MIYFITYTLYRVLKTYPFKQGHTFKRVIFNVPYYFLFVYGLILKSALFEPIFTL